MGLEFMLGADFLLQLVQFVVNELNDVAAFQADQMVVAWPPEGLFIPGVVFAEAVPGNQAAVDKQVECIIDGGPGNLHPFCVELCEKVVRVEVTPCMHNLIEQEKALARRTELFLFEILNQDVFCSRIVHGGGGYLELV